MALFLGTAADETITSGGVSGSVTVLPAGGPRLPGLSSDVIYAGGGNDTIDGGAGSNPAEDYRGMPNLLLGGQGDDSITVRAGDRAEGGTGNDTFVVRANSFLNLGPAAPGARIDGGEGVDTLQAPVQLFRRQGGLGNGDISELSLTGVERLELQVHSRLLLTAGQLDGFDTVNVPTNLLPFFPVSLVLTTSGKAQADIAGTGALIVTAADGDDTLLLRATGPSPISLRIDGGAGNDRIVTGAGDDSLQGGAGDDILNAGHGNDTLVGGAGRDRMAGGAGDDTFVFAPGTLGLGNATDHIVDFQGAGRAGGDVLRLDGFGEGATLRLAGSLPHSLAYEVVGGDGVALGRLLVSSGGVALAAGDYLFT
ncbi:hypothetical protein LPC08_22365 [Roseomonas sp. OT10]|uniref:calcium-binding protein n=1 Tax=Roseomonas cutis TaxID=2897332 RepID=UPI001E47B0FC|nr:calcium-binding protein [Roseomonas sp. OT10]UFN48720.1 hypothetical protein LPC08_22365 [Roseomonas sp. OT10]